MMHSGALAVSEIVGQAEEITPRLQPYNIADFLNLALPQRKTIITPWLPEKGLAMIVAPRGIGKTLFALSCAYAAASGGGFLGFNAPSARRVLYLDGEMPARTMQERIAAIVQGFEQKPPESDYFRILTSDLIEGGLPDLSTLEGQDEVDAQIADAELIILDNLSTLMRTGKENEAESWRPVQDWALRHRRAGRSILFVHHAGRNGSPRGTSKREDVLDTVISLRRPENYASDQGARFEVHFEKARGFFGKEAEPFEALYEMRDNAAVWSRKSISDVELIQVIDAIKSGLSIRDAAEETGLSRSKVQRLKERASKEGLLNDRGP